MVELSVHELPYRLPPECIALQGVPFHPSPLPTSPAPGYGISTGDRWHSLSTDRTGQLRMLGREADTGQTSRGVRIRCQPYEDRGCVRTSANDAQSRFNPNPLCLPPLPIGVRVDVPQDSADLSRRASHADRRSTDSRHQRAEITSRTLAPSPLGRAEPLRARDRHERDAFTGKEIQRERR